MTIYATYPYDSKEMKKHATEADPWTHDYVNTVNVPAFGAYCLERWVKDDEFVLKANPNYYRGKPASSASSSRRCRRARTARSRCAAATRSSRSA